MEQQSSTSKVTVEYFDPHNVYRLLAPGLIPRLPLRNLHWQSHVGPLRSIDALHVNLVRGDAAESTEQGGFKKRPSTSASLDDGFQTQHVGGHDSSSDNAERPNSAIRPAPGTLRRHQIPGIRSTPYLKVLLVRCDDNDSYKNTVRSEIREWIKVQTSPSGSGGSSGNNASTSISKKANNQEKHDAFEWLVVHVVIPNSVAATQPRSTSSKSDGSSADKTSTSSRWRPGSSPLLEKFRSDFNSSSKGAPDRIAQIRIGVNDVPYDQLPRVVPAVPSGYFETEQDAEVAWNDLIGKLKSLILISFDMRVTQYEEDIKEKDSQRSLPGWNFCTFFILKEGLARGFENVGLVEDALVGYDELSVGLDTVIRDQAESGSPEKHGGAMLPYTEDLKRAAKRSLAELLGNASEDEAEDLQKQQSSDDQIDDIPISSSKKPYRDMILANQVSVFDFRCYLFSRQVALLLRLGNASATREELLAKLKDQHKAILHGVAPLAPPMNTDDVAENLGMLSEVCRRTLEFIPSISRVMREDMTSSLLADANEGIGADAQRTTELDPLLWEIMGNQIASFAFTVAQQILAQTTTKALPIPTTTLTDGGDGADNKASIPEPKTTMHPARTSSLHTSASARPPPSTPSFPGPGRQPAPAEQESQSSSFLKLGLEELAAQRAELYLVSRSVLDGLGKSRGWCNGWSDAPLGAGDADMDDMEEIDLDDAAAAADDDDKNDNDDDNDDNDDDDNDDNNDNGTSNTKDKSGGRSRPTTSSTVGIENRVLKTALDNSADYYRLYEILTDKALIHFKVASHNHAVHACEADMAVLKVHLKEYSAATSRFLQATPFFGLSGWTNLELSMLIMYCRCLAELQMDGEYVRAALTLLIKSCSNERMRQRRMPASASGSSTRKSSAMMTTVDLSPIRDVAQRLSSLIMKLPSEVKATLSDFFMDVKLVGSPEYHDGSDSCSLSISLRSLLPEVITLDAAKLRITCIDGGPCREVNFEFTGPSVIVPGKNTISLKTNSNALGSYRINRLVLTSSNLLFHHEQDANQSPARTSDIFRDADVTLFQRAKGLNVQLTSSKHISLGKNNALDLIVTPGWNALKSCELRIRSTTGGLRLLTTEAKLVEEEEEGDESSSPTSFAKPSEPGAVYLGPIAPDARVTVRFPYSVEQDLGDVSVRVEVAYVTEAGELFHLAKSIMIPVSLAVGVNVQDVFKHNALFSRFNIETASSSPLRLLKSELLECELFESSFGCAPSNSVMVFPKQQAALLYKITRKRDANVTALAAGSSSSRTLRLKLYYSVLQREIEDMIQQSVMAGLKDTPLELYSMMTAARVLEETRRGLQAHDLERAALVGQVTTAYLEDVAWARHFRGIGLVPGTKDDAATKLAEFLDGWQKQHPRMAVSGSTACPPVSWENSCSITIPVEIPSLSMVHTADIRIEPSALDRFEGGLRAATVNQVLPATLHLKWTRAWDTDGLPRPDQEFSYEVTAPADSWLLGGRRRGHFVIPGGESPSTMSSTAETETETEMPLLLIPQREGHLPYPTVEIKEVPAAASAAEDRNGGGSGTGMACEVDWKNVGETVRVVSEKRSVTVSLDASGPGGGPLVLGSESMGGRRGRIVA
ncbi:hypothetical protein E4U42_003177 [Claviceps africana]|uniref:TMEM1 family protein n=1 Tax=Claviceps africana TaxID=83212 RepID=A0A8K0NJ24_9HYPO|nr:hypothetical protein E4U42_003177 [Claviceps africana]